MPESLRLFYEELRQSAPGKRRGRSRGKAEAVKKKEEKPSASTSSSKKEKKKRQGSVQELWQACLAIIRDNVSQQVFKTWFEPIVPLRWQDNVLTVQVPSQFFYEWLEEHYYPLIEKTIKEVLGTSAQLQYEVIVDRTARSAKDRTIRLPAFRQAPKQTPLPFAPATPAEHPFPSSLVPHYTFDTFVRGESNQLAVAASLAVAENPGMTRYNPLVIYGPTGVGKTHLAHAIGNAIVQKHPRLRVLYTNSERFTVEYINALQYNKISDFTQFYRSVDVLIVDDIQFFIDKEKTQDHFFHTFNTLHQAGKQLVLTSDRPPKDLRGIDDRLISRFQWGLIVDIQPPDYELRLAILQQKAAAEGVELPSDVAQFLARHITQSVRELEGCLISLIAKVALDGREMNLALAQEVVQTLQPASEISMVSSSQLTVEDIIRAVAAEFNLSPALLTSKTRRHTVAVARHIAMYFVREILEMPLKKIALLFGRKDHTTVIHACQTVEQYRATDPDLRQVIDNLERKIRQL